jgi:predicted amidohydrolase YtcJ
VDLLASGAEVLVVSGLLLLPGLNDPHAHFYFTDENLVDGAHLAATLATLEGLPASSRSGRVRLHLSPAFGSQFQVITEVTAWN